MVDVDVSLSSLAGALAARTMSSVEATRACLDRIARADGALGAYRVVFGERALAQAAASDARRARGEAASPIDGAPIALKDNLVTEGMVTTAGSKILASWVPPYDATVVAKLKAAGAVIVGKTNMDEFGMGGSTEHSAYEHTKNPWDLARTPGGSSGGSAAAVAASLAAGALGTDTGGSIRQPAAFCGVVGLKPTYGRVSRFGVVAYASSLDQVGPLAPDVHGAALLFDAIQGFDARDATSLDEPAAPTAPLVDAGARGLRVGIPRDVLSAPGLDDCVRRAFDDAVRALTSAGAVVVDTALPHARHGIAAYYLVATAEASSNLARFDGVRYGPRLDETLGLVPMIEATRGKLFGDEVKRRILLGTYALSAGYYDAYYLRAQKVRRRIADDFAAAFAACDVVLMPTTPQPAFMLDDKTTDPLAMYLQDVFTILANLAGLPACSVNAGFSTTGAAGAALPCGVQVLGRALQESTVLCAARAIERELHASPGFGRRPPEVP